MPMIPNVVIGCIHPRKNACIELGSLALAGFDTYIIILTAKLIIIITNKYFLCFLLTVIVYPFSDFPEISLLNTSNVLFIR